MSRLSVSQTPQLVGRKAELEALWRQFELAAGGGTRVALLAGEPGIGKTRLFEAFAARATGAGAIVLHGGASEIEGMPPYFPFLEALGQHLQTASTDALRAQVGGLAPVLETIFPDLSIRLGIRSSTFSLPAEQARLRLFEAVTSLLSAIADEQPLVILLDDLQWADSATVDLLCFIARRRSTTRLLIVGAVRDGEIEWNPALERALGELNRQRVLDTITLNRLTLGNITTLAAQRLGGPLSPAAAQPLFRHSEGNPFFAEELVQCWLESGALVFDADHDHYAMHAPSPSVELALPSGVAFAIRQRLARLPKETVDLLKSAAIIGRSFETNLLAEVFGLDAEVVEDRLHHAAQARLLQHGTDGSFAFSHDKIRECLYQQVTPVRRRRLHGLVGQALEAWANAASPQRLADLAFHFARSGDRERGAHYARRAAAHAMTTYAPDEAITHLRTTLSLIDDDDPLRGNVFQSLGEAALLAGAEQDAVQAFCAARTAFQSASDPLGAARAAQSTGHAWWRQEAIDQARAAFEDARTLLEVSPGSELVAVLIDLGTLLSGNLHLYAEGIAHCRRALALAQDLADDRLVVAATRALGNLLVRSNELPAGATLLEEALVLATSLDDPLEASECCAGLTSAYLWQGRIHRSRDITVRRLALAERCHDRYQLRHVHTWLGLIDAFLGNVSTLDAQLERAQPIIGDLSSPEPQAFLNFTSGIVAMVRGEYAAAERQFGEAMAIFRRIGPSALLWYLGCLGLAQAACGHGTEARACLVEMEALLARVPERTIVVADALAYHVAIALMLDDRDRLARYGNKLVVFGGQFHDMLIDRLLGEVAIAQGHWGSARTYLQTAEAAAREERLPWELARTLEAQAAVIAHSQQDQGTSARALVDEALQLYEQLGNQREASRLRGRLAAPGTAANRQMLPAALTRREAEVLRLIATGRSNRDIADQLSLSEKTVEKHLTSAYGKIGADNRAAASAFAVRHGLA